MSSTEKKTPGSWLTATDTVSSNTLKILPKNDQM